MFPFAEGLVWLACCSSLAPGLAPAPADATLRTFVVEQAPAPSVTDETDFIRATRGLAAAAPNAHGLLRSTIGVGYVEHAGWGVEALSAGAIGGFDLQLDSLFTFGTEGPLFDHGTVMLRRADQRWLAEAGDLFSDLRGPSSGARVVLASDGSLAADTGRVCAATPRGRSKTPCSSIATGSTSGG